MCSIPVRKVVLHQEQVLIIIQAEPLYVQLLDQAHMYLTFIIYRQVNVGLHTCGKGSTAPRAGKLTLGSIPMGKVVLHQEQMVVITQTEPLYVQLLDQAQYYYNNSHKDIQIHCGDNQSLYNPCQSELCFAKFAKVAKASPPDPKPHLRKVKFLVLVVAPLSDLFLIRQFVSKIPRLSKTYDFVSHAVCQDLHAFSIGAKPTFSLKEIHVPADSGKKLT
ncbi:hypothetical protein J6590_042422 [Homalodisca vitripennis]|nr:hypothetical protein J6590_042422 [Homalodisca vitripennis]